MERHIEISILYDIYGKLLTEKQCEAINDYYNNDLSLSEIAENQNISRQAVRDLIKKGEDKLFEYERALKIMKLMQENQKILKKVCTNLDNLSKTVSKTEIDKIKEQLLKLK